MVGILEQTFMKSKSKNIIQEILEYLSKRETSKRLAENFCLKEKTF